MMTSTTNRKLHAFFSQAALALNEHGLDVGFFLTGAPAKTRVEWDGELVKKIIWKTALLATSHKTSTKELTDEQAEALWTAIANRIYQLYEIDLWQYTNNY